MTQSIPEDIRWQQRFENFQRALTLLKEPASRGFLSLSRLEQEGVVQRFEFTVKLSWNTLKDFLSSQGIETEPWPRRILKTAYSKEIIEDWAVWDDMLTQRNTFSHKYDERVLDAFLGKVETSYIPAFDKLLGFFKQQLEQHD